MAKKVNWASLHKELKEIFGEDEQVIRYESGDYKEYDTKSKVVDFFTGINVPKLKDVNIVLLSQAEEIPYDDCSQDGNSVIAVFTLDDKIYRISFDYFSSSGFSLDYAKAEEVAPKIKQIIYYD